MEPLLSPKRATTSTWSDRVSDAEAHARATGRARYNRERQLVALIRRNLAVRRYMELHIAYGAKAQIAREFKVHRSTITRWIRDWSGEQVSLCPTCFHATRNDEWDLITEARKHQHVEDPISDAAQARRAVINAIHQELPRALADIQVFFNDPDDDPAGSGGPPRAILLPSSFYEEWARLLAERIQAA